MSPGRIGLQARHLDLFRGTAHELMAHPAFARLGNISFLGILSLQFASVSGFPLKRSDSAVTRTPDGTRANHSVAVSKAAQRFAIHLQLSEEAQRYAVVWGLLHDIATWPLSHTGEAGFSKVSGVDSGQLRCMMVTGSHRLPSRLSLYRLIKSLSIDSGKLLALFDRADEPFDYDLMVLHRLIHSPFTPDTLEGIRRTGLAFGLKVPTPSAVSCAFENDLVSGLRVRGGDSEVLFRFWRAKSLIYRRIINRPKVVEFESAWSNSIRDRFCRLSLTETLELTEAEVLHSLNGSTVATKDVVRYKPPQIYTIAHGYRKSKHLSSPVPAEEMAKIFLREPMAGKT